MVPTADIAEEEYNLSVSTYVEQEDTREKIDLTELTTRISESVAREEQRRTDLDEIILQLEGGAA